jgi:predicted nucleic acid-binding protein
MSKPRVYVETTILSAYYTDRKDPEMVKRGEHTRRWWATAMDSCELVTSITVTDELAKGTSEHVASRLLLLEGLQLSEITSAVSETMEVYITRKVMPANPSEDALHLALASHHSCDVLITWNYRHLANSTKFDHIRRINVQRGLSMPPITTPADLLGG